MASDQSPHQHEPRLNTGPQYQQGWGFTKQSPIRKYTEPAGFALYPYIAGLTVMNDPIAIAVQHHSSFTSKPWSRLLSTIDAAILITFGSASESQAVAERLWSFHNTVAGTHPDVQHYSANDASLQTWVLACVFKGAEESSRRWAQPLDDIARAGLYQDIKEFGQMFGIHPSIMPATIEELDNYWESMIEHGHLLQTDASRTMAQTVFRFSSPRFPKTLARIGQAVSITSLDPRLQEQAGLYPTKRDQQLARVIDVSMRQTYSRIPRRLRTQALPWSYVTVRRQVAPMVRKFSARTARSSSKAT